MERHAVNELRTIMVAGRPVTKVWEDLVTVFAEQLERIEQKLPPVDLDTIRIEGLTVDEIREGIDFARAKGWSLWT